MIENFKAFWRSLDLFLKFLSLIILFLSTLLVVVLTVVTKGIFFLVVFGLWGSVKLLDWWAKE